jgi:hypothetical protein
MVGYFERSETFRTAHVCADITEVPTTNSKGSIEREDDSTMRDFGLRREVDEDCALLGYCAACSGNFLPKCWDNL